jgi:Uma2 family endonuclease
VVVGSQRDYATRHPRPEAVLLVVEVSDTTPRYDQETKARDYAIAGIPEYWIVNLPERLLEVRRDPSGDRWETVRRVAADGTASPLSAPGATVRVADLLP